MTAFVWTRKEAMFVIALLASMAPTVKRVSQLRYSLVERRRNEFNIVTGLGGGGGGGAHIGNLTDA